MAAHSSIFAWGLPMDGGAWWATVHGITRSWTQLSDEAQHHSWCVFSSFDRCLVYLHFLTIMLLKHQYTCFLTCFQFSWLYTQKLNSWSDVNPVFNFLRNCQTVFQSSCTLHSHHQCRRALFSSISSTILVVVHRFDYSHLCGCEVVFSLWF